MHNIVQYGLYMNITKIKVTVFLWNVALKINGNIVFLTNILVLQFTKSVIVTEKKIQENFRRHEAFFIRSELSLVLFIVLLRCLVFTVLLYGSGLLSESIEKINRSI